MNFDQAYDLLIKHEGGFSNHPDDKGGATMWGVTEAVARQNGYTGAMKDLTQPFAKIIYRKLYWDAVSAEQLPDEVRYAVFDAAVNSGTGRAIKWLQQAVNEKQDGVIGSMTLRAVRQSIPSVTAARINGIRLTFMTNLPNWPAFGKGWARRIASNLTGSLV
jgi:lysozyme family protein